MNLKRGDIVRVNLAEYRSWYETNVPTGGWMISSNEIDTLGVVQSIVNPERPLIQINRTSARVPVQFLEEFVLYE